MKNWMLAVALTLLALPAMAQDEETPEGWSGKGEAGFVNTSGNSDTQTLNLGVEFIYNSEQWRHTLRGTALRGEEDGELNAERYVGEAQSDYILSDVSYLFGAFRHDSDKFSAYDFQQSLSFGYGRQILDNERHNLKAEIGPGIKRSKDAATNETETQAIARGLVDYVWTISDNSEFANRFLVEAGGDNTYVENGTSLTVAMNDKLAMKFGFQIRHNTDVPVGTDDTDTLTTANLVYNFK